MITVSQGRLVLVLATTLIFAACAIKPLAEWHDPNFTGKVDNVLIIAVSDQPVVRRQFEDTFVRELAALGIAAKPSYQLLSDEQIASKDALDAALSEQSIDTVLVTRVIGVEQIDTYTPPTYTYSPYTLDRHYRDYYSYYNHAVQVATPGYWDKYEVLKIESNLYDRASRQLIWSIQTENFDPRSARHMIDDQLKAAMKSLRDSGLIP